MKTVSPTVLQRYPAQAPRYTSYPTAPHFTAFTPEMHAEWIAAVAPETPVSLYLHIPYCKQLCWFCGCHTKVAHHYTPVISYIDALCSEIETVAAQFGRKQPVLHIHFGGGSPTILMTEDFSRVMDKLRACFNVKDEAQIAIEIDPRTVNEAKIARYAHYGVNRVSIGIQDFDEMVQAAINRYQPFRAAHDTVRLCREYEISDISLDLVYGLPKQSLASFERTLEYALLLRPSRFALFGYAHVPWKKQGMQLIKEADLPDAALRHAMFTQALKHFAREGYRAIGLDHFVLPEDPMAAAYDHRSLKRNFQGYSDDRGEVLIGLGASSISTFPQGYVQNTPDIERYKALVCTGGLGSARGIALSAQDRMRRAIIAELMCYNKADVGAICRDHGEVETAMDDVLMQLEPMVNDALVTLEGRQVHVTPDLPQAVRLVCAAFDSYFKPQAGQHAQIA